MNGRPTGRVIELLGAPGCGKTGLARALAAHEGVVVVKDHQAGDLSSLAWSMARSWPVAVAPPADVDRRRWASWAARVTAARHVAASRIAAGASTVVFDQGAAYTLVRMLPVRRRKHGNEWWSQRCSETASMLDLVVLVDADPGVLVQRLRDRRKDHVADHLSDDGLRDYLDAERRDAHLVADSLARDGADVIRLITTAASLADQAATILAALDRHAPQPIKHRPVDRVR